MFSCADYIAKSKACMGDPSLSDAKLGARLQPPIGQQAISRAKSGAMTDTVALAIGRLLEEHGVIAYAGEVLLVAHAERDADPSVRQALMRYAKNVVASVPKKAAALGYAAAVALGSLMLPSHDAMAFGGAGRPRQRR